MITYVVIANTSRPETAGYVPVLAAITILASLVITRLVSLVSPTPAADVVAQAFGEGGAGTMPRSAAAVGDAVAEGEPA